MNKRIKVNVKLSSEVNTILHDLFNQIQYEFCEQYEEEIERLQEELDKTRLSELDKEYRINKAIEYIENPRHEMSVKSYQELLDILKGE